MAKPLYSRGSVVVWRRFDHLWFKKFTLCHSGMCQRVCFHRYWNVYLDENKEMWVALHLSARKLQTVFLFPAVMLVAGEALGELRTGKKKKVST